MAAVAAAAAETTTTYLAKTPSAPRQCSPTGLFDPDFFFLFTYTISLAPTWFLGDDATEYGSFTRATIIQGNNYSVVRINESESIGFIVWIVT